jgi:hypothetical protein
MSVLLTNAIGTKVVYKGQTGTVLRQQGNEWGVQLPSGLVWVSPSELSKKNPAKSAAQYRMAQAVLSGSSKAMPISVARELVEKTPHKLRSEFMSNPMYYYKTYFNELAQLHEWQVMKSKGIEVTPYDRTYEGDRLVIRSGSSDPKSKKYGFSKARPMRRNPELVESVESTDETQPDISKLVTTAFSEGVEVGKQIGSSIEPDEVDVVENPSRKKRNSIFLTPAMMQSFGQTGVGQLLTKANPKKPNSIGYSSASSMALRLQRQGVMTQAKDADRYFRQWASTSIDYQNSGSAHKKQMKEDFIQGWKESSIQRNPESTSAEVYEQFHGKPSEQLTEYVYEEHEHENLAQLGELLSLTVVTTTGYEATIQAPPLDGPATDVVQLCSSEDKMQLYLIGGDQCIDVSSLGFKNNMVKDLMLIGVIEQVEYCTEKKFHKFKPIDYYHKLGEESGIKPVLLYDPISQLMKIAGGNYSVKPEGITD